MTDQFDTTPATPAPATRRRLARIAAATAAGLLGLGVVVVGVAATGTTVASDITAGSDTSAGTWGFGFGGGPEGHGHRGPGGMMGDRAGGPGGHLADAATALGITTDELATELQAGKSIADVASAKGVSLSTVVAALVASEKQEIADAVTAGRLTQAQADQLLATVEQHVTDMVNRTPPAGGRHGGPGGFDVDGKADELAVIATSLGITTDALKAKLTAGATIASIAADENVAVDTVVAALVAHEKGELAAAVAAGRVTRAQADEMATRLEQRVTDQVNGTFRGGRGGPDGHRGHGGRDGHRGMDGGFGPGWGPDVSGGTAPTSADPAA